MAATQKNVLREMRRYDDKTLFTSAVCTEYLRNAIAPSARRYKVNYSVRTFWENEESAALAYTDQTTYSVNTGHPEVLKIASREERLMYILGEVVHEYGHGLFTNFQLLSLRKAAMTNGDFFPEPPETDGTSRQATALYELKAAMQDPVKSGVLRALTHEMDNICEDGRIEMLLAQVMRGFVKQSLMYMRDSLFLSFPTLSDMADDLAKPERSAYFMLQNMLLSYSLYGKIKGYGQPVAEPPAQQVVQVFEQMVETVDAAIFAPSAIAKAKQINKLLLLGWPIIKPYVEQVAEKSQQSQPQDGQGQSGQGVQSSSGSGNGAQSSSGSGSVSSSNTGNGKNCAGNASGTGSPADQAAQRTTQELRQNAPAGQMTADNSERCAGQLPAVNEAQSGAAIKESQGNQTQTGARGQLFKPDGSQGGDGSQRTAVTADKDQRQCSTDDVPIEALGGNGTVTRNDAYKPADIEEAAKALRGVLEACAQSSLNAKEDSAFALGLNTFTSGIKYADVHKGVTIQVNRIAQVTETMKEAYNATAREFAQIAKETVRTILPLMNPQTVGRMQNNRYSGTSFNACALVNRDLKVFGQKSLPGKPPSLAVALRVDESGSMSCGNRASYARAAAITLQQFCEIAKIPCYIYGDTTSNTGVELYAYTDAERPSPDDKYRLMDIGARGSNRDGAAIQYVAERLMRSDADVKLCFIVSDGQPNAHGYRGKAAVVDLQNIVREYKRKAGIIFIAAAIGDDKDIIRNIYGSDKFLDISDIKQLPKQLAHIVRRHI